MSRFGRAFCASSARAFSRWIRAAVIHDDDFARNIGLETFAEDARDRFFLVQRRNDYGNAGHRKTMCAAVKYKTSAQISASASVIGPAAIFGSSLSRCKSDGTPRPKRQAVTRERAILPPMAPALRKSLRQNHTIKVTTAPHARPSSTAVSNSRRSAVANQRHVTGADRNI